MPSIFVFGPLNEFRIGAYNRRCDALQIYRDSVSPSCEDGSRSAGPKLPAFYGTQSSVPYYPLLPVLSQMNAVNTGSVSLRPILLLCLSTPRS